MRPWRQNASNLVAVELLRHAVAKAALLACFAAGGLVTAVALAGCGGGGGGNVAATGPVTRSSVSVTRPSATRPAATESSPVSTPTQTRPAATVTETGPSATVTQTRPAVTVTQTSSSTTLNVTSTVSVTVSSAAPQTTTASTSESSGTPAWFWVLVAVGGVLLITLLVWLQRRRSRDRRLAERQRLVAATVAGWAAQGWAIENRTESSAVMQHNRERILVTVEADGRVTSRSLDSPGEPAASGSDSPAGPHDER
jgi:hypothetical protein